MSRIGILTFVNANNYGAQLQLYSLINLIKNKGFNVNAIDININRYHKLKIKLYFVIRKLLNKESILFDNFRKEYIIDYLNNINELNNYDCVIVGSDQIWNYDITNSDIFMLPLKLRGLKVSYGASIGKNKASSFEMYQFSKYISDFDYVSVRESALRLNLLKIREDIEEVLDPVFLMTNTIIDEIAEQSKIKIKEDYILVYMLEYNAKLIKNSIYYKKQFGYRVIYIVPDKNISEIKSTYKTGPREFLYLMKNAKYIITNSFHGLSFSIIFKKNFSIFPHSTRNDRITNLLSYTNLDYLIQSNSSLSFNKIDYVKVENLIKIRKDKSLKFIDNFLRAIQSYE